MGFVPCFKISDETPECLDTFLYLEVNENVDGFIAGIAVEYSPGFPEFVIQSGAAIIHNLIILWTADHSGQSEVNEVKRTAKEACCRCLVCGIPLEVGLPHYFYGNCRYHARYKLPSKTIEESIPLIKASDEEVGVARCRASRDSAFTGLCQLTVLFDLYGFDVLFDRPIDLIHNLSMDLVKKYYLQCDTYTFSLQYISYTIYNMIATILTALYRHTHTHALFQSLIITYAFKSFPYSTGHIHRQQWVKKTMGLHMVLDTRMVTS